MDKKQHGLIGQRLLELGYLTEAQLEEALKEQEHTGLLLGEVCLLKGFIEYSQLEVCLPEQKSRIGQKLMAYGYISVHQLQLALIEQKNCGDKIGEIFIRRGWIDKATLDKLLK